MEVYRECEKENSYREFERERERERERDERVSRSERDERVSRSERDELVSRSERDERVSRSERRSPGSHHSGSHRNSPVTPTPTIAITAAHSSSAPGSSLGPPATTSSSSKPKPCPIILAPSAVSPVPPPAHPQLPHVPPVSALAPVTLTTPHVPLPSPSAKHPGLHPSLCSTLAAGGLQTPLYLSSPMLGGPRTPNPMLHFWSSLSPAVTLSPRPLGSATGATAFHFPSYPALTTFSPIVATFPHPLDTPGLVPSPTSRSIPVL